MKKQQGVSYSIEDMRAMLRSMIKTIIHYLRAGKGLKRTDDFEDRLSFFESKLLYGLSKNMVELREERGNMGPMRSLEMAALIGRYSKRLLKDMERFIFKVKRDLNQ